MVNGTEKEKEDDLKSKKEKSDDRFSILEEKIPVELIDSDKPLEFYEDEEVEEPPLELDLALEMLSSDREDERVRAVHFIQKIKPVEAVPYWILDARYSLLDTGFWLKTIIEHPD